MSNAARITPRFYSVGSSLAEVLVSLIIFSVTALGLMNLQQRAIQSTELVYQKSQALILRSVGS